MMPRKKRIAILVISIVLGVFLLFGILAFLILKTDTFKSNEELFAKYLIQNFDFIDILKIENTSEIENMLNTNKYQSELEAKIQYTENIETSDENKNSPINKVNAKVKSNIDNINNYIYKDISIQENENKVLGFEYLKDEEMSGVRLSGVKQFVSSKNDMGKVFEEIGLKNLEGLLAKIDINSIIDFSNEEKQALINNYVGIIQSNVPKDKYYKQSNVLITVNDRDIKANSYYIKFTVEQFNNLYVKILEQIAKDEIILSRIDLIENEIKKKYADYKPEQSLKDLFINKINDKIQEIQNNNIGSEEVRVTVYANNKRIVRTSIEKTTNKLMMDIYNNESLRITNIDIGNIEEEKLIKIEKSEQSDILLEFEEKRESKTINNVKFAYQQLKDNDKISKLTELMIKNERYEGILNVTDKIQILQDFENQETLYEDNIMLDDLSQEQINSIIQILKENVKGQVDNLNSIVNIDKYSEMLQNLKIIDKKSVQLPSEGEVTEIEKRRFNSQFEFFASENLTSDNIKDLVKVSESNFEDMKVILKDGNIEELVLERLDNSQQGREYKENISEIVILVKRNSSNQNKMEDTLKFIEKERDNKYTVSIEYDNDGLTRIIRMKIQEKK